MAQTKSKMQRLSQIQDDLNYDLSRQFIGNQNTVYKKLKQLTDIPSAIELHQEIDERIGKPQPQTTRNTKAPVSARKSSLAIRDDTSLDLTSQRSRRELPSTGRSVSAINIRNDFAKKKPLKSNKFLLPPPKEESTPKTSRPKSRITNIQNITPQKRLSSMGHANQERDLLEIKKKSLKRIGIDLKDQIKVDEHEEKSQESGSPTPAERRERPDSEEAELAEKERLEKLQLKEKADQVTNRLYEAAMNRQKKINEDDLIRKEAI